MLLTDVIGSTGCGFDALPDPLAVLLLFAAYRASYSPQGRGRQRGVAHGRLWLGLRYPNARSLRSPAATGRLRSRHSRSRLELVEAAQDPRPSLCADAEDLDDSEEVQHEQD